MELLVVPEPWCASMGCHLPPPIQFLS